MTLDQATVGNSYTVAETSLPLPVEKRLEALGMTRGTRVFVLNAKSHGTLVIKVRGSRFAIGRGITGNITVTQAGA